MQLQLPTRLHLGSFDGLYERLHRLAPNEPLKLDMDALRFAEPAGLLPLTCVLRNHVRAGGALTIQAFPSNLDVCGYLERMNFYKLLKCSCPHRPGRRKPSDTFIEITEIGADLLSESIKEKLYSLFAGRVDVTNVAGQSFLAACGELVQNTRHAYNVSVEPQAAGWPDALILGQYYQPSNQLHFTVADCGIGILRSLGAKDPDEVYKSEKQAIERALVLGMRGIGSPGKGLGLAAIRRFMKQNRGLFSIRSGICLTTETPYRRNRKVAGWKGTVVSLEINGARNVDIKGIMDKMVGKLGSKK